MEAAGQFVQDAGQMFVERSFVLNVTWFNVSTFHILQLEEMNSIIVCLNGIDLTFLRTC